MQPPLPPPRAGPDLETGSAAPFEKGGSCLRMQRVCRQCADSEIRNQSLLNQTSEQHSFSAACSHHYFMKVLARSWSSIWSGRANGPIGMAFRPMVVNSYGGEEIAFTAKITVVEMQKPSFFKIVCCGESSRVRLSECRLWRLAVAVQEKVTQCDFWIRYWCCLLVTKHLVP